MDIKEIKEKTLEELNNIFKLTDGSPTDAEDRLKKIRSKVLDLIRIVDRIPVGS